MILPFRIRFVPVIVCCLVILGHTQRASTVSSASDTGVIKAKDAIEITGVVVAHSLDRVAIGFEGISMDILVVRFERKSKGVVSSRYVRVDFWEDARVSASKSSESLYEGKPWRMKLSPPPMTDHNVCAYTVPPLPQAEEVEAVIVPHMVPVGGARGYPDVNSLPCYELRRENLHEIRKDKKK
jgi:hypothetical protein